MELCLPQQNPVPPPPLPHRPGEPEAPCQVPARFPGPGCFAGLAALFLGLVAALVFSGAAAAREVSDPGALVRWGLPVSKAVHNIALATVIGGLLFAVGILPRSLAGSRSKDRDAPEHPAFTRALAIAAAAGAAWTLSAIAVLVLSYSDIAGQAHLRGPGIHPLPGLLHDRHRDRPRLAGRCHHRRRGHHGTLWRPFPGRPGGHPGALPHRARPVGADRTLRQLRRPRRRHQLARPAPGRAYRPGSAASSCWPCSPACWEPPRPARSPAAARISPNRRSGASPPWPASPSSSSSPPASSIPASASPPGTTSSARPTGS